MNWKRTLAALTLLGALGGMVSACKGDPRKNCNHPQHGQYMSEKLAKKNGIPR